MKLYHITRNGNLHFQLKNGRLAAVYIKTGYVRVSRTTGGRVSTLNRFNEVVKSKKPGNINMWPINNRVATTTKHVVNSELFYELNGSMYKYPNEVFFEMSGTTCVTYPNNITTLMDLLTAFEAKNS